MARRNTIMVSRTIYQIGIMTLVTAILWVGIEVYLTITKTSTPGVDTSLLEPIPANIDQKVVEVITNRLKVEGSTATESATIEEDTGGVR